MLVRIPVPLGRVKRNENNDSNFFLVLSNTGASRCG
jgi:hypothetical protein